MDTSQKPSRNVRAGASVGDAVANFRRVLERFVALAHEAGARVRPYSSAGPVFFAALAPEAQAGILRRFELYTSVCESVRDLGYKLTDDRQMLWAMIRRLQLRPHSDLFSVLTREDILEIYLVPEFVQVFRSFRFFYLCSYTLDDLLCRPWWELYVRDAAITDAIMVKVRLATGQADPRLTYYEIGPHCMDERESEGRFRSLQEARLVAPLFDEHRQVGGMVNVIRPHNVLSSRVGEPDVDLLPEAMSEGPSLES